MQATGHELAAYKFFGKPHPPQYRLLEKLLLKQAQKLGLPQAGQGDHQHLPFCSIYAIGDNPAADVRGARNAGGYLYDSTCTSCSLPDLNRVAGAFCQNGSIKAAANLFSSLLEA